MFEIDGKTFKIQLAVERPVGDKDKHTNNKENDKKDEDDDKEDNMETDKEKEQNKTTHSTWGNQTKGSSQVTKPVGKSTGS